jgi:cellulose biosynthesis protein BcsQ
MGIVMPVFAIYNIKGGVGKTATAVNLSYLASLDRFQTLLCDLDPQSSATFYFRIKPKIKAGSKALIKGGKLIEKSIKGTDFRNLDLLPADFSLRNLDIVFDDVKKSKKQLQLMLKPLKQEYEYIFLDCPPNITLVSENIFQASDFILIPIIPTTLSYRTYDKLFSFFKKEKLGQKKLLPFFSMVEKRKRLHQEIIVNMPKDYKGLLETKIPYSSEVEKMGIRREPLNFSRPNSIAAMAYNSLWIEIKNMIFNYSNSINSLS